LRTGFVQRLRRITLQARRRAHRQHPDLPAGALRQRRHQVAVTSIVADACQHGQLAGLRPLPAQGPPGGVGGALHQFKTGRAGGNQGGVERAHLFGAVQYVG
jgi:hypothetical protein